MPQKRDIDPDQLYSVADAAKALRCSTSSIRKWYDQKLLEGVRLSDGQRAILGKSLVYWRQVWNLG